jgi:polyisoprenoid-binding protein YceI
MDIRKPLVWFAAGVFATLIGVAVVYFFVLRPAPPPPVNLGDALASIAETDADSSDGLVSSSAGGEASSVGAGESSVTGSTAPPPQDEQTPPSGDSTSTPTSPVPATSEPTATLTPTAASTPTVTSTPAATPAPSGSSLLGGWHISSQGESFVGYRVREELARVGFNTAVGRTTAVDGTLTYDGQAITAVRVVADLSQLVSDDPRRENHLRGSSLETELYPTSTFVLTSPIVVGSGIDEGTSLAVTAIGDLTIHGVTQRVAIPLQGQLSNGLVVVVGSLEIQFADYNIDTPDSGLVLSVEDHGTMELQLVFEHD